MDSQSLRGLRELRQDSPESLSTADNPGNEFTGKIDLVCKCTFIFE